ncbi:MAG TPA: hypothetical protein VL947_03830 [Cytophagales bacterium]|nr:hypothetical protein [Cytophagales bacterium]
MDLDDAYLSLLFNEDIFIERPKAVAGSSYHDIVVYATHSPDSIYEDNLNKCFQRLNIDVHKRVSKIDHLTAIDPLIKTLIFSDAPIPLTFFPELKYTKSDRVIWFDSLATITLDSKLKMLFWDKFQEFFS